MKSATTLALAAALLASTATAAPPDPKIPPIVELKKILPKPVVFKEAKRGKPIEVRSAEDAAKFFPEKALKALQKKVDFDQQFVLVFAWKGSGQDKLKYDVAESFPEQIQFRLIPGLTRDLRPHVHVYVLRSNVKWRVAKPRRR